MKLAVIFAGRSKELPIFLHDDYGKSPVILTVGPGAQLAFLVILSAAFLWAWTVWVEPMFRVVSTPAVRVARAQQVNRLEVNEPLKIGDVVVVNGKQAPSAGRISALPRQTVSLGQPGGTPSLMVLGANRYYVVTEDGSGEIIPRAHIRGVVQSQL